ncbi:unnamed protein product [Prorocentrum cordatum]|uniref:Secreted protein n=1 Tax=Prorocentrum cordatum TaxID=2364126 RepID=A0ABN9XV45_9DINO|nr:unnamed protein product [Polarella glacialis]
MRLLSGRTSRSRPSLFYVDHLALPTSWMFVCLIKLSVAKHAAEFPLQRLLAVLLRAAHGTCPLLESRLGKLTVKPATLFRGVASDAQGESNQPTSARADDENRKPRTTAFHNVFQVR